MIFGRESPHPLEPGGELPVDQRTAEILRHIPAADDAEQRVRHQERAREFAHRADQFNDRDHTLSAGVSSTVISTTVSSWISATMITSHAHTL